MATSAVSVKTPIVQMWQQLWLLVGGLVGQLVRSQLWPRLKYLKIYGMDFHEILYDIHGPQKMNLRIFLGYLQY